MKTEIPEDAMEVIDRFRDVHHDILQSEYIPVENLYHYTGSRGLKGMLSSGTLWMTNVCELDDPMDTKIGFGIVRSFLGKKFISDSYSQIETLALSKSHSRPYTDQQSRLLQSTYITSFTRRRDDELMYEGYADSGRGCCVGFGDPFVSEVLDISAESDPSGSRICFYGVIYDEQKQLEILSDICERYAKIWSEYPQDLKKRSVDLVAQLLYQSLLFVSLFFKQKAYSHEDEIRMFLSAIDNPDDLSPKLKFVEQGDAMPKRCELDLDSLPSTLGPFTMEDKNFNNIAIRDKIQKIVQGYSEESIVSHKTV